MRIGLRIIETKSAGLCMQKWLYAKTVNKPLRAFIVSHKIDYM